MNASEAIGNGQRGDKAKHIKQNKIPHSVMIYLKYVCEINEILAVAAAACWPSGIGVSSWLVGYIRLSREKQNERATGI